MQGTRTVQHLLSPLTSTDSADTSLARCMVLVQLSPGKVKPISARSNCRRRTEVIRSTCLAANKLEELMRTANST